MTHFPDTPSFTGFNTPSRIEADIADLDVKGEIPVELDGAFYRVQPDPQFPERLLGICPGCKAWWIVHPGAGTIDRVPGLAATSAQEGCSALRTHK